MGRTTSVQSLAGAATVIALPLLYLGGVHQEPLLTAIGLVLFTLAMLTTPVMRFLVRWATAGRKPGRKWSLRRQARAQRGTTNAGTSSTAQAR